MGVSDSMANKTLVFIFEQMVHSRSPHIHRDPFRYPSFQFWEQASQLCNLVPRNFEAWVA
jgi:hypothetical protein